MKKPFLFTPGPTPLPPQVYAALSKPIINHRSQDFKKLIEDLRIRLKELWQTSNEVLILTASGTGAMEAALSSCLRSSDRILTVNAGKFGERWAKIGRAYRLPTDEIQIPWGHPVRIEDLEKRMTEAHSALLMTSSETSTGTQHPIDEVAQWMKKKFPRCLFVVDGMTSVGASPTKTDEWGVDLFISGSQKALMLPPGLAFVSVSKKAIERMSTSDLPRFYLDLKREHEALLQNQTAYTPNINLCFALQVALQLLFEEGLTNVYSRHERLAKASRASLQTLGLELASKAPSVACSAAFLPKEIDGKSLLKLIREDYGFTIAGGQDQWEGRAIRLSHLGYYSPFDLMNALTALGCGLRRQGFLCDTSKALKTFIDEYSL